MRNLEILQDRFGALEAVANSSIKLARYAPEDELAMDLLVAKRCWSSAAACAKRWMMQSSGLGSGGWDRTREDRRVAAGKACGCRDACPAA